MISVFISHSSRDNSVTREICQRLGARGYESLFVYYRPEDDMVAGQQWWPQIMENVRQARVFMIVASASWKASDTCNQEMTIARAAGKPMVILRCDDVDLDPYLENIQAIDFRTPDDYSWRQLAEALAEAGADPCVFRPDPSRPPFPGLPAFEVEDSALYFGRETEIIDVLSRLEQRRLSAKRLFVIAGPSGSGKSSLLRAGILARLRRKPARWVPVMPFRPSHGFEEGVVRELAATCKDWYGSPRGRDALRQLADPASADPDRFAAFLRQLAEEPDSLPVLAVDQGEELFADGSGEARDTVASVLARLLASGSPVLGLITIRSDALGDLQQHPLLGDLIMDDVYALAPMPRDRYALLIDGPVQQYARHVQPGACVEPKLRDALTKEAAGADALPLIAFTLRRLWDDFGQPEGRLLASQLDKIGGVGGAVTTVAERLIADARRDPGGADLNMLKAAFVPALAGVDEHGAVVRRHAPEDVLPAAARPLLDRFVQARLLVRGDGPDGRPYLEVAHETLLRQWPLLAGWIKEESGALRVLEELGRAATAWQQAARNPELLVHRGNVLAQARQVSERDLAQRRFAAPARAAVEEYLTGCETLERESTERLSREIMSAAALYERAQQEAGRLRPIHAAALYGAVLDRNPYLRAPAEVMAACAPEDARRARSLAWRARSEAYGAYAKAMFGFETRAEVRQGFGVRLVFHPDNATISVIGYPRPFDISLPGGAMRDWPALPDGDVLDYLPGTDLVLLSRNRSVRVVERSSGRVLSKARLPAKIPDLTRSMTRGRLCAVGTRAVVTSSTHCFLADFTSGQMHDLLSAVTNDAYLNLSAMSSVHAGVVAVAGAREVFVVDPVSASAVRYDSGQRLALFAIEILSEGNGLVFGGVGESVHILDPVGGKPGSLDRHRDRITSLAVLAGDGKLVSTGLDGRAMVWDLGRRRPLLDLPAGGGRLHGSAASPDGRRVAIAGEDGVTVWRKIQYEPVTALPHGNRVTGVAYDPGTRGRIVSVSWAGERCAAIWTVGEGPPAPLDLGIRAPFFGLAMAPRGDLFALWGNTAEVTVYSAAGQVVRTFVSEGDFDERGLQEQILRPRDPPPGYVRSASLSCDSRHLAWIAPTGRIWVGDVKSGKADIAEPVRGQRYSAVCFSPAEAAFVAVTEAGAAYWAVPAKKLRLLAGQPRLLVDDVATGDGGGRPPAVAFSRDGRKVAIATSGFGITIAFPGAGVAPLRLDGHADASARDGGESVTALAFALEDALLISGGSRQSGKEQPMTIRCWDPHTGDLLMQLPIPGSCVALSADPFGQTVCAAYGDEATVIPLPGWLLSRDTAAVRQKLEGILGSPYDYDV